MEFDEVEEEQRARWRIAVGVEFPKSKPGSWQHMYKVWCDQNLEKHGYDERQVRRELQKKVFEWVRLETRKIARELGLRVVSVRYELAEPWMFIEDHIGPEEDAVRHPQTNLIVTTADGGTRVIPICHYDTWFIGAPQYPMPDIEEREQWIRDCIREALQAAPQKQGVDTS